ncbi:hypothetical protein Nepgr_005743 [Nepenthes gracilis]|uniref:RRM domain-containing protein n=1 Tax=Nepenthes gracilis TaxID=150966 RepID=A0AAD3S3S3_NEPGR|nr:hypothetical protein Nepgr_005743 [Nepenthes gracilis]
MAAAPVISASMLPRETGRRRDHLQLVSSIHHRTFSSSHLSFSFYHVNGRLACRRCYALACLPPLSSSSGSYSSPKPSSPKFTKLFVSGLSFRTTEESLRNAFQDFGQLIEVNLVMDKIANRPRGFAFLRYATEEESKKAIEGMHGKFLHGRVIFVEVAKPRSELRNRK